ncbi:group II intron maturase-specific domain-containing protein [Endozoicomonas acroporae]
MEIAREINPRVRGWIGYFGRFYASMAENALYYVEDTLVRWAMG